MKLKSSKHSTADTKWAPAFTTWLCLKCIHQAKCNLQCPHPPLGARCSKESLAAAAGPCATPVADRRLAFSSIRTLHGHRMVTNGISFRVQATGAAAGNVRNQLSVFV